MRVHTIKMSSLVGGKKNKGLKYISLCDKLEGGILKNRKQKGPVTIVTEQACSGLQALFCPSYQSFTSPGETFYSHTGNISPPPDLYIKLPTGRVRAPSFPSKL